VFMFTTGKVTGPHRILVIYRRSAPVTGALAEIEALGPGLLEVRMVRESPGSGDGFSAG